MTRVIPALGGRDRGPQSKPTKKTRQWGTLVSRNPPSMNEVEEKWRRLPHMHAHKFTHNPGTHMNLLIHKTCVHT